MLVPTCPSLIAGVCVAAGADPNVFKISSTAIGAADGDPATVDSCVGLNFTTEVLPDAFGTVRFTPTGGQHVTLPTNGTTCEIRFTFDVLAPSISTTASPDVVLGAGRCVILRR